MIRSLRRFLVNSVAGAFAILPLAVGAATTGYTSKASFNAAVVSLAVALTHFDDKSVGDAVAGGAGFSLSVDASGLSPVVASGFWTTSASNYLGLNRGDGQFIQGDLLHFGFAFPVRAFGLDVIGGADMLNFADVGVRLTAGSFTLDTSKTADQQDGQGSYAFFLGVISDTPVANLTISGFSPGFMEYAVDDIRVAAAVPEPSTWLLLGAGLFIVFTWRRRNISLRVEM